MKVGTKIGTYNQNRAKKWKPLMTSLTGTQTSNSNSITSESFKKLVKDGIVDRAGMRYDSGKVTTDAYHSTKEKQQLQMCIIIMTKQKIFNVYIECEL
jgi:hypothetical protein